MDYVVLHQKIWDSKECSFTKYNVLVLLQPRDKKLSTSRVNLTVYNDSLYSFAYDGSPKRRIDFDDSEDVQEAFGDLSGAYSETEKAKIWYTGTLTVGDGREPQYSDFQEKEERIAEIHDWADNYLQKVELDGNVDIFVRDFREEDSSTKILIERKDGDPKYLSLDYYFYQDNDFQELFAIEEDRHSAYIEKLKRMSFGQ